MSADDELAQSWPAIRTELERAVPAAVYQVWLERIQPVKLSGRTLVVAAPERYRRHIAGRFARVLQTCAAAVLGPELEVDVVGTAARADAVTPTRATPSVPRESELNPKYTFDQFVIGEGNRLAHGHIAARPLRSRNGSPLGRAVGSGGSGSQASCECECGRLEPASRPSLISAWT